MRDYDFDYLEADFGTGSDTSIDLNELLEQDQQHRVNELRISIREKQRLIDRIEKKIYAEWGDFYSERDEIMDRVEELQKMQSDLENRGHQPDVEKRRLNQLEDRVDEKFNERRQLKAGVKNRVRSLEEQKQGFEDELALLESELRTEKHDFESVRDFLE